MKQKQKIFNGKKLNEYFYGCPDTVTNDSFDMNGQR